MRMVATLSFAVAVLVLACQRRRRHRRAPSSAGCSTRTGSRCPESPWRRSAPAQVEPRLEVTDREGRYRIAGLPPGRYAIRFTLPGFGSVVRDGIDVGANLDTTVDAEMSVGWDRGVLR